MDTKIFTCTQEGGRLVLEGGAYKCLDMETCRLAEGTNPICHLLYRATSEDYAREARIKAMWAELPDR